MANLKETAELAYRQLFPNPGDETALDKEDFVSTAKTEYAYQMLLMAWKSKATEGEFIVPSYISREVEKDVVDNVMDISDLDILKSLPSEMWLQNIGGLNCGCKYVKTTINLTQLLCDDNSLPDDTKTYYVIGKKIKFPQGAHAKKLTLIYANNGSDLDADEIVIDDAMAGIVRTRLIEIYGGKTGVEDRTNNSNPNG